MINKIAAYIDWKCSQSPCGMKFSKTDYFRTLVFHQMIPGPQSLAEAANPYRTYLRLPITLDNKALSLL